MLSFAVVRFDYSSIYLADDMNLSNLNNLLVDGIPVLYEGN